jgi:RecB family exonuclease
MNILAPISAGELIDKITILAIKSERLADEAKRANVLIELAALQDTAAENLTPSPELDRLTAALKAVNEGLWDIEDGKRDHERRKDFGDTFIALARRVYMDNDQRAAIKKEINLLVGSKIVEEKSYQVY